MFGGECQAFKEDDIKKRLEEQKNKEIEERKRLEERKKIEAIRQERERQFNDNFAIDELDFERGGGISEKLPKSNDVKASIHKPTGNTTKQSSLSSYMNKEASSKMPSST